ncbi:MAG: General secretion pathway protein J [uncultured Ramlibacter sp.]|uniref:General secretion pathway protein J n=1 Tax=uncultured Ramlibacter sp. TaxID=260755 RepID=A0A6J4PML1_9BURK|nr:MAG: General secretion pathway protein J [uncultured Ramlibacter sp.]
MSRRHRLSGFTLVELLVALFVLSLLAVLSWRGLDGMARAQQQTQARSDEVQALQIGLAQWSADLDAMLQVPQMTALDWNGRVLRLTRRAPPGQSENVVVVGWSRRTTTAGSRWTRWQSPPLTTRGQVEDAWLRADAWAQNQAEDGSAVAVTGLQEWQVFYYRSDAWTNPLSSDATQASPTVPPPASPPAPVTGSRAGQIPDGVRIVLTLAPGQAITGELIRDWVRPTVGGGKS